MRKLCTEWLARLERVELTDGFLIGYGGAMAAVLPALICGSMLGSAAAMCGGLFGFAAWAAVVVWLLGAPIATN